MYAKIISLPLRMSTAEAVSAVIAHTKKPTMVVPGTTNILEIVDGTEGDLEMVLVRTKIILIQTMLGL